jgi:hypothetical protein
MDQDERGSSPKVEVPGLILDANHVSSNGITAIYANLPLSNRRRFGPWIEVPLKIR